MPWTPVRKFEEAVAEWAGAKYGVAVESCSAAIFLSCLYREVKETWIPRRTYPSVPMGIIHAGGSVKFGDEPWQGVYELGPWEIFDGALRFRRNMYQGGLHCLSFHAKKLLPIGRGGMILTDDNRAYEWLKLARFDGRTEGVPLDQDDFKVLGWNMMMTPPIAAYALQLFMLRKDLDLPDMVVESQGYPDLSKFAIFQK